MHFADLQEMMRFSWEKPANFQYHLIIVYYYTRNSIHWQGEMQEVKVNKNVLTWGFVLCISLKMGKCTHENEFYTV